MCISGLKNPFVLIEEYGNIISIVLRDIGFNFYSVALNISYVFNENFQKNFKFTSCLVNDV